jgi:hypothetical protein
MGSSFGNIEVRGVRENNLKNISLDIPRRQITVLARCKLADYNISVPTCESSSASCRAWAALAR